MLIVITLACSVVLISGISFWVVSSLNRDYKKTKKLLDESQNQCKSLRMLINELQDEIEAKTIKELEPVSSIDS
jgi:hypothetical protein